MFCEGWKGVGRTCVAAGPCFGRDDESFDGVVVCGWAIHVLERE